MEHFSILIDIGCLNFAITNWKLVQLNCFKTSSRTFLYAFLKYELQHLHQYW
jgi:hypothetical protein